MTSVADIFRRAFSTGALHKLRTLSGPARKRLARFLWPHPDHELLINRECSVFGDRSASLTRTQRELIGAVFDIRKRLWDAGETPVPPEADVYSTLHPTPPASVAVVMPRYVGCDPAYIDHDIAYHVARSAAAAGARVSRFDADSITYRGSDDLAAGLESLKRFLADTKPELVAFDGGFIPNGRTIDVETLASLKRSLGFKLVSIIGDCYDGQPADFLGYWHRASDLSLIFHRRTKYLRNLPDQSNVLVGPTLPFHEGTFAFGPHRDIDLSFIGSDQRERRQFLDAAARAGITTECRFHDRSRSKAPDLAEYTSLLGRSKLTFNNGWVHNGENIITARVGEAILSGAVLIQETCAPMNDYFVPFVHYVPVANLDQTVAFSQFLLENDERRARIADDARKFWDEHYASARFWRRVAQACALTSRAL